MAETKVEDKVEEAAKIDLFEDDDEFEEFEIGLEVGEKNEIGTDVTQEWEDDWDDDDVNDDFSLQLKKELQNNATEKNEIQSEELGVLPLIQETETLDNSVLG